MKALLFIQNIFPNLIGYKHTHNSPQPVTDDQIWKNLAFNEPMTSKVQLFLQVNALLTEKTWGRG